MDPIYGKLATFLNLFIYILIRWPHGIRVKALAVSETRRKGIETVLLLGTFWGTTLIPVFWMLNGFPASADYPLHPMAFGIGVCFALVGHWMFHRSHVDLGLYWSPTLQVREEHQLITTGVYAQIRHPMYSAMFLQGIGQMLFLPNWFAGPAWLVTFSALYLFRVGNEERMMSDRFGPQYDSYCQETGRLMPRLSR